MKSNRSVRSWKISILWCALLMLVAGPFFPWGEVSRGTGTVVLVAETVHVPALNAEWVSRLNRAETLLSEKAFAEAMEILQRAIESAKDQLFPLGLKDREGKATAGGFQQQLYISVSERARRMLLASPEESIRLYRETYEPIARSVLVTALQEDSRALLEKVALDYFPAPSAIRARLTLGDRYFEKGFLRRALQLWRTLPRQIQGETSLLAAVRLRILGALRALGDGRAYDRERATWFREIRQLANPEAIVSTAAKAVKELERSVPLAARVESAYVPVAGTGSGKPVVNRLPGVISSPGAYGLEWINQFWSGRGIPDSVGIPMHRLRARRPRLRQLQFPFCFVPDVSEGVVYISSVFDLFKIELETGRLAEQIPKPSIPDPSLRRSVDKYVEKSDSPLYWVTLDDSSDPKILLTQSIVHLVPFQHFRGFTKTEDLPTRALVAYDAKTNNILWDTVGFQRGPGDDPRTVSFVTPPLIRRETVYAGGWFSAGYLNGLVAAFDRRTGEPLWHTLLASGQLELTMFGEPAREPMAWVLLEDEGILYCVTGLGVTAALDAENGRILWLSTYEVDKISPSVGPFPRLRNLVWDGNPPLLVNGVLYVTPRDSLSLYALETGLGTGSAESPAREWGEILWSKPNTRGYMRHLLGYRKGRLYFSGPRGIRVLDISRAGPGKAPKETGGFRLRSVRVSGRAAMAEQGIVFTGYTKSDSKGVTLVDYELNTMVDLTDATFPDEYGRLAGNVTVHGDRILVTSRVLIASFAAKPVLGEESCRTIPPGSGEMAYR